MPDNLAPDDPAPDDPAPDDPAPDDPAPAKPAPGTVAWLDITVTDAAGLRDFYANVIGWKPKPVPMGAYADYNMTVPSTGDPTAGVCHAKGGNADLPPVWLSYVNVADLDASMQACLDMGGDVVAGPKGMEGQGRYCVIRDPAGAHLALFQPL
jgi:predicted enzyme related to lactoylglutathione lyase